MSRRGRWRRILPPCKKRLAYKPRTRKFQRDLRVTIVSNSLHWAALLRLHTERYFIFVLRLLVHIGVATVFIASVVIWRHLATQVAVDALCVTVKFTVYVVFVFVFLVCHVEKAFG